MRNVVPFKFFALHKGNLVNQSTCIISFIPLAEYGNFFRIKDPSKGPVPNHSTTTNDTTILSRVCIEPYAGRFRTSMPPREQIGVRSRESQTPCIISFFDGSFS